MASSRDPNGVCPGCHNPYGARTHTTCKGFGKWVMIIWGVLLLLVFTANIIAVSVTIWKRFNAGPQPQEIQHKFVIWLYEASYAMILGVMGLAGCFLGVQGIRLRKKLYLKWALTVLTIMLFFGAAGCVAIVYVFRDTPFLYRLSLGIWLSLVLLSVWENKKALERCEKCY
ncbi:unnamed protein product, partial [Mesorhabditis spiculigera]